MKPSQTFCKAHQSSEALGEEVVCGGKNFYIRRNGGLNIYDRLSSLLFVICLATKWCN